MIRLWAKGVLFGLFGASLIVGVASGQDVDSASRAFRPYVSYRDGELRVAFLARDLQSFLNGNLDNLSRRVFDSDLHTLDLANFRAGFANGGVLVSLDYHAKVRGGKKYKDLSGHEKTYYTPWVSESGTVQALVHVQVDRWTLLCYCRNGDVGWRSDNRFTRMIADAVDQGVRDQVALAVHRAIVEALAGFDGRGRHLDLRPYVLKYGPDAVARATGLPVGPVRSALAGNLDRLPNTSITDPSGVTLVVRGIEELLRPPVAGVFPGVDPGAARRAAEAEMFLAARQQAERDALRLRPPGAPAPGGPVGEPWFLPGPAPVPARPAEGAPAPDVGIEVPGLPPGVVRPEPSAEPRYFAPNLGITYVRVPYADGTFGARVVRPPVPNSPAAGLGLEPGDVVFELDGMRLRTHQDVLDHTRETTIGLIDVRTNESRTGSLTLP